MHAEPAPGDLRDALARALRDPSLTLAYWLPEREEYVDVAGHRLVLPTDSPTRTCTLIEDDGRPVAAIIHDASLVEDRELVRAVGAAASLALENERLEAELRAKVEELRASRARIVESADAARRRIERDLHDGAQQQLVALAVTLRLARTRFDADPDAARELLEAAARDLDAALRELRELARGIHPAVLSDRGLDSAVQGLVGRMPLPVEVTAMPEEPLPKPIEAAAYFVVAEAITNVARYAEATHATVQVVHDDGAVVVEIADDGIGGADPGKGSGLRGLADRVAALDGRLEVDSERSRGTTVRATIPAP
jgi:signal transduction histidine kinase